MITGAELCERVAAIAESYEGVCACVAHRHRFESLLASYRPVGGWDWRPFSIALRQGMSTCGLFGEACEDEAGLDVPWHGKRYAPKREVEKAVARNEQWARGAKCWQQFAPGVLPQRGHVLTLTAGLATHELVVVGWEDNDRGEPVLVSIDGGQTCKLRGDGHDAIGRQAIRRCRREWRERAGKAYLYSPTSGERLVHGWVVAELAPVRG